MRVSFFSFCCTLAAGTAFAQTVPHVESKTKVGKHLQSQTEIQASEYFFSDLIDEFYVDSASNTCTVHLRALSKNGKYLKSSSTVMLYDLAQQHPRWSKKINLQVAGIYQAKDAIIHNTTTRTSRLQLQDGKDQWSTKTQVTYALPSRNIGFGYQVGQTGGTTNSLEGIDLSTGRVVWRRNINREFGWNDVQQLNDSVVLIAAAGLHTIHLRTGKGWNYEAVTGSHKYGAAVATAAAGVALGVLTGAFFVPTGDDVVRDIASNVVVDSSAVYLASKEEIACLSHTGEVKWRLNLPKDAASKSTLFIRNGTVYLVNKGYAVRGGSRVPLGQPFIAAIDKATGQLHYLEMLSLGKEAVTGLNVRHDQLYLLTATRIFQHDLGTGQLQASATPDPALGQLAGFIGSHVYLQQGAELKGLAAADSTRQYVFTSAGKYLALNRQLEVAEQLPAEHLFTCYLKTKKHTYLARKDETVVLDQASNRVAELRATRNATLIGTKLYDVQGNNLLEIDLRPLEGN